MFKLYFIFFIVTFSFFPHLSYAECCRPTRILFHTKGIRCPYFGGGTTPYFRRCEITVCGDGKTLGERSYCGKGACNVFGCNCDGGCKQGDAVENFKAIHGRYIYNLTRYSLPFGK